MTECEAGRASDANPTIPQGWACPKCGKIYAPDVPVCMDCNSERTQTLSRAERRRKRATGKED